MWFFRKDIICSAKLRFTFLLPRQSIHTISAEEALYQAGRVCIPPHRYFRSLEVSFSRRHRFFPCRAECRWLDSHSPA